MKTDTEFQEIIKLLTYLLNEEVNERNRISADLHSKSAGLGASKLWLEMWGKKSKKHLSTTNQLTTILNECMIDVKRIVADIYPRIIIRKGLIVSLKEHLHDKNKIFGNRIDLLSTINDDKQLKISLIYETAIYRICLIVIEFMLLVPFSSIQINISLEGENLILNITGTGQGELENKENEMELTRKITLIKAIMAWQQANILPETNWISKFKFSFKLPLDDL
jgi:signal transduction histidine kinase